MKEYKATYGTALIYTLVHVYLSCTPMMILAGIICPSKDKQHLDDFCVDIR